ncbi:HrpE/YscL family type III secretion apparatus protein [Exilibacterium tricleocarpae]|uniref:Flagellar assembly protein FliH n=1 Tax=Exilibacterium tricleocarpae TaxID=2591008 RepID=A0A545SYA4_9GAMM|nr:type III secretion system stator protein SctL [Exilibacterium tricleocarpae]TQV69947.1 HrpE/YscL family type III secretion apparatus protein [Exilibacterium tricleocarpae]
MKAGSCVPEFDLMPNQKIITADQYQQYEQSVDLINMALQYASKMEEKARQAYEMQEEFGYQSGVEKAQSEMLSRYIFNAERAITGLEEIETDVIDIVLAATRKVIGEFSQTDRAKRIVVQMLKGVKDKQKLTLNVAEESFAAVRQALADFQQEGTVVDVVANANLVADSFVLETPTGIVDGSLGTQMNILETALRKNFPPGKRSRLVAA